VPFERLVQAVQPARRGGANPIFQILFGSVPATAAIERFGDLAAEPYVVETVAAAFDLSISFVEEASGAGWVEAEYRTGCFTAAQIASLLERYVGLLAHIVDRPDLRISEFSAPPLPWTARPRAAAPPPVAAPPRGAGAAQPDAALERTIAGIWERVLRCRVPGTVSDFFDLGGHSLQAMLIAHEIGEAIGRPIPVSLVFQEPTIAGMARALRSGGERLPAGRGPAPDDTRPPLFACGSVLALRSFIRALQPAHPSVQLDVFALQEQRWLAGENLLTTLPDIAAVFLRDILAMQPEGRYLLAGQCEGGLVALEIALQLRASGREVALMAQLDTPVDGYFEPVDWVRRLGGRRVQQAIETVMTGGPLELSRRALQFLRHKSRLATPEQQRVIQIWSVIWQAVRDYRQSALYDGEIQLFRAENRMGIYQDFALGWERRVARVRVHDVPGTHYNYLSSPATLRQVMAEIERALGPGAAE
jgi:thioesterase domain-containing protein